MSAEDFDKTYIPLRDSLYKIAFYILESSSEAEDALQDLYIKLWKNRAYLSSVSSPKGYAVLLLKNLCIDRLRRNSHRRSVQMDERVLEKDMYDCDSESKERIYVEELERALGAMKKLPPRQAEILQMRALEDLSYDEIAERTGVSKVSLRVILSNARRNLKKLL